jgi:protein-S-isoprenylcysteine O-methyltransferase Ste14
MKDWHWREWADFGGRIAIVAYFTFAAGLKIAGLHAHIAGWATLPEDTRLLRLLSDIAVILFLLLVVATTLIRLKPIRSAEGLEPRFSALAGTFLLILLSVLPAGEPPKAVIIFGLGLVMTGFALSSYVLAWLGRSFSIMPEARRLVTHGPYSLVRHPLYIVEEIAAVGIIIMTYSLPAVVIGLIHWGLQLRRMHNEEKVLRAAFPEYDKYCRHTPRVIPRFKLFVEEAST